jgi:hypothetical protein
MIRTWPALAFLCAACTAVQHPPPASPRALTAVERAALREQSLIESRIGALLRDHFRQNRCWVGEDNDAGNSPETSSVVVRFRLDANGTLIGEPRITSAGPRNDPRTQLAIERALQAVRACSPYPLASDPTARERYDLWREIEINFDTVRL